MIRKIPTIVYINLFLFFIILIAIFYPEIRASYIWMSRSSRPIPPSQQSQAIQLQQSFRSVYKVSRNYVVSIRTKQSSKMFVPYRYSPNTPDHNYSSLGSGFIITENGMILTNYHVIKGADSVEIILPSGKVVPAGFVGSHEPADLALLKIQTDEVLPFATFGNSDEVDVGDWAIAVGSPFGLEKTFTLGIISAKAREDLDDSGQSHIQIDTAINPGSSGGPLLNIYGEVIGVNRMIRSSTGQGSGIGFAIPSNYTKKVIKMIEANVGKNIRPASLGVLATVPISDHRSSLGLSDNDIGLLIYDIENESSADLAGLKRFDFIKMVNDMQIHNPSELREQVALAGSGGLLKLTVIREKKEILVFVKLIEKKYY
jgi:serine protease Do